MKKNRSKKKNPIYVVTNKGKDIEEASSLFDMLIKKVGLTEVVEFFKELLLSFAKSVNNYALFKVFKALVDNFVQSLEKAVKFVDPILAFSIFGH